MSEVHSIPLPSRVKDRMGQVFGRLTVVAFAGSKQGEATWLCHCKCGQTKTLKAGKLVTGGTVSCGCFQRESAAKVGMAGRKHSAKHASEYGIWRGIIQRCTNPKSDAYAYYGGRGITMCDRWRASFEHFLEDMGPKPSKHHTVDRVDNNAGYSPDNCVWATRSQQSRNMRNNRLLTFQGETKPLVVWAEELGMPHVTLRARLHYGWTIEEAMTQPVQRGRALKYRTTSETHCS